MSESDNWLERYEQGRSDLPNPWAYWTAVLMVVAGTVGFLWSLPIPAEFRQISPLLNWGSAFLMAATIYYFIISLSIAIGLLPFVLGLATLQMWLTSSEYPVIGVSTGLFVAGIAGLWLGRRGSGGLWRLVQDLQLMMIGPAWLLSIIYRRFGIPF